MIKQAEQQLSQFYLNDVSDDKASRTAIVSILFKWCFRW